MEIIEFKNYLMNSLKLNNIDINLNDKKISLLFDYMNYILEKNKYINLTAIKDEKEFIYKHYVDSLYIVKHINKGKLIDIGTGGGFPGIPLLIVVDDLEVTLLDSKNKKLKVIEEFVKKNDIKRVKFVHSRAEHMQDEQELKNKFDYAVTRAVSDVETVINYSLLYLKKEGKGISMRGKLSIEDEELVNSNKKIKEVIKYSIKDLTSKETSSRSLLIFKLE